MNEGIIASQDPFCIKFSLIRDVDPPLRKTEFSSGIDICCPHYSPEFETEFCEMNKGSIITGYGKNENRWYFFIRSHKAVIVPTGLKLNIPKNWFMLLTPKSGIGIRTRTVLLADTIDQDFQGELKVVLQNTQDDETMKIYFGQAIVQGVLLPAVYPSLVQKPPESLYEEVSKRGEGGFGSTGIFHS